MTIPFNNDDVARVAEWLPAAQRFGADSIQARAQMSVRGVHIPCNSEVAWLDARAEGVGASEVGVIMGVSTFTSPYALWWQKKLGWRLPRTEGQRWGHLVEDPIGTLFAEQMDGTLYLAKPLGHPYSLWCHPYHRWAMCTPDRVAQHIDGFVCPVELKSDEGGDGWGEPETDQVPAQYAYQAMWQAYIMGAPGTYVVRKHGSGRRRLSWYWVPLDMALVRGMLSAAQSFLTSIASGDAPAPDGSTATSDALKDLNAVMPETFASVPTEVRNEWFAARDAKNAAIARERLASNMLRVAMGTAEFATATTSDGLDVVFAKRRVGKREGYSVAPGTVDELRRIGGSSNTSGAVPPRPPVEDDPGTSAPPEEESTRGGGGAGTVVGASTGSGEAEAGAVDDPSSPALDD